MESTEHMIKEEILEETPDGQHTIKLEIDQVFAPSEILIFLLRKPQGNPTENFSHFPWKKMVFWISLKANSPFPCKAIRQISRYLVTFSKIDRSWWSNHGWPKIKIFAFLKKLPQLDTWNYFGEVGGRVLFNELILYNVFIDLVGWLWSFYCRRFYVFFTCWSYY